jgi:hypothetical protein
MNRNLRNSLEVVLELIEKSDYIYSRKAFDHCPLPVLILNNVTHVVEYANDEFVRTFGRPEVGTPGKPFSNTSVSRNVGGHEIRVLLHPQGSISKTLAEDLTSWLSRVSKPTRTSDLVTKTAHLTQAVNSFSQVVNTLLSSERDRDSEALSRV